MPNLHLRYGDGNNNGAQNTILFARCQWLTVGENGGGGRSSGFLIWMGRTARNQLHERRPTSTHVHIHSCATWSSYEGLSKFVGQEADFL